MARFDIHNYEQWLKMAEQSAYNARLLSKELKVSERQLRRYTRERFGCSPQSWLHKQRLINAADILKELRSVKAVAYHLGFKQVSHFSREFKSHYGLAPTDFLASFDHKVIPSSQDSGCENCS
jgi:AraC-like DNA-binding protein